MKIPQKYLSRQAEITNSFLFEMNKHMDEFMAGKVEQMHHLRKLADTLCLHPVHVSNVVKLYTGKHPCFFYEQRILAEAKKLLDDSSKSIGEVADRLTYDVSNFTKFFKQYAGVTPSAYRRQLAATNEENAKTRRN